MKIELTETGLVFQKTFAVFDVIFYTCRTKRAQANMVFLKMLWSVLQGC